MVVKEFPIYVAGKFVKSRQRLEVLNPYNDRPVGLTFSATKQQLEQATKAAVKTFEITRKMGVYERVAIFDQLIAGLTKKQKAFARMISLESAKPIKDAEVEAMRAINVLTLAKEEAKRIAGEVLDLDLLASSDGRWGIVKRFPVGPVAGISPFNYPLNLAIHKVAPTIAAGCTLVLKVPSRTPLTMMMFAELIDDTNLPKGAISIMAMDRKVGDALVTDDRFKLLSFTGSPAVGWKMKERSGKKKVVLELGGNAGALVDESADIKWAAKRLVVGAFSFSGQICISTQRLFVHKNVYDKFVSEYIKLVKKIKLGNPIDPQTQVGPMIEAGAVKRTEKWVNEAIKSGSKVLTGGKANGKFFEPTVLDRPKPSLAICSEEAFAPVVNLYPVNSFTEGIKNINNSAFGLQAGVFTNSFEHINYAFQELEVGGVVINDVPGYRIDHMPYGGVKDSGLGREGLKYSIEDMTELRLMVLNNKTS
ncbi:MAG: aldehyde dehydrogenase [Candidatus Buchananbacteria bacterium CG10_big_fil_rev_8_21_14_0_10_42_9]|uniref:Aldehyde dehydrogenase n=1 Tax=Candidatus Buchananbacteria bacterium CG10_big_fil_rev_8_21_14_0_10_42_9 TaxID=1974526 RepID=A0A2H0W1N0_9BACT|nr:MAG: aldehyde dehydrogenase [Candidatus Buchananbacteria bacterium CG10_big_fil_rev_8_21_14_0_10_42_9]